MYTKKKSGEGVIGYDLMNLTPCEMRQMRQMHSKLMDVMYTHHPKFKGKKMYLSDDDMLTLIGMLGQITRDSYEELSCFDNAKRDFKKYFDSLSFDEEKNQAPAI